MEKSIFSKIIDREEPGTIIYEDEMVIAIVDKYAKHKGHFLVIPKRQAANMLENTEEEMIHAFVIARRLAKERIIDEGYEAFKILINTGKETDQTVFHTHIHVIPYGAKSTNK